MAHLCGDEYIKCLLCTGSHETFTFKGDLISKTILQNYYYY